MSAVIEPRTDSAAEPAPVHVRIRPTTGWRALNLRELCD